MGRSRPECLDLWRAQHAREAIDCGGPRTKAPFARTVRPPSPRLTLDGDSSPLQKRSLLGPEWTPPDRVVGWSLSLAQRKKRTLAASQGVLAGKAPRTASPG